MRNFKIRGVRGFIDYRTTCLLSSKLQGVFRFKPESGNKVHLNFTKLPKKANNESVLWETVSS